MRVLRALAAVLPILALLISSIGASAAAQGSVDTPDGIGTGTTDAFDRPVRSSRAEQDPAAARSTGGRSAPEDGARKVSPARSRSQPRPAARPGPPPPASPALGPAEAALSALPLNRLNALIRRHIAVLPYLLAIGFGAAGMAFTWVRGRRRERREGIAAARLLIPVAVEPTHHDRRPMRHRRRVTAAEQEPV